MVNYKSNVMYHPKIERLSSELNPFEAYHRKRRRQTISLLILPSIIFIILCSYTVICLRVNHKERIETKRVSSEISGPVVAKQ